MNDDKQYLILHKVRGKPQFDIADKAMFGDEEGWSLCTCGHRAWPYQWWDLDDPDRIAWTGDVLDMPPDTPEHYPSKSEPRAVKHVDIGSILSTLVRFKRRI